MIQGSADDQIRVWTIALTLYVFMTGAMFVVGARDGVCPSHYILKPRFDGLNASILFCLLDKILDALKLSGLYKFALRMGTDPA